MTAPLLFPVGFGAFKIGRNEKIKYPTPYDLPTDAEAERLLNQVLDLGINFIDTAPAYGISEERIGRFLAHRRGEFLLSSKAGESFSKGESTYDFSKRAIISSVEESLRRLKTERLDFLFLHSDGSDVETRGEAHEAIEALRELKEHGLATRIGISPKFARNAEHAMGWADAVMVELSPAVTEAVPLLPALCERGITVLAKKCFGSGHLAPEEAIRFVLGHSEVACLVAGTLSAHHLAQNVAIAKEWRPGAVKST